MISMLVMGSSGALNTALTSDRQYLPSAPVPVHTEVECFLFFSPLVDSFVFCRASLCCESFCFVFSIYNDGAMKPVACIMNKAFMDICEPVVCTVIKASIDICECVFFYDRVFISPGNLSRSSVFGVYVSFKNYVLFTVYLDYGFPSLYSSQLLPFSLDPLPFCLSLEKNRLLRGNN